MTIHRKVQSPDQRDIRKMSEIHVRKVREVETGGRPTPLEDPYCMLMNLSHTGFTTWMGQRPLYQADYVPEGGFDADEHDFLSNNS